MAQLAFLRHNNFYNSNIYYIPLKIKAINIPVTDPGPLVYVQSSMPDEEVSSLN